MSDVAAHYDSLLAEHYSWMVGSFAEKAAEQEALLRSLGVARGSGQALDLGSGPGYQSVALAHLGYRVTAIDLSVRLLEELAARRDGLPIETVHGDLTRLDEVAAPGSVSVAVCMGDTLTHLESRDAVEDVFRKLHRVLSEDGLVVLTWRDLTPSLAGVDRFIPVRADADRIMTCFLEYEPETVVVHDLIHERQGETWHLRKSSYRKLRLGIAWVREALERAGFAVEPRDAGRLACVVGHRRDI